MGQIDQGTGNSRAVGQSKHVLSKLIILAVCDADG